MRKDMPEFHLLTNGTLVAIMGGGTAVCATLNGTPNHAGRLILDMKSAIRKRGGDTEWAMIKYCNKHPLWHQFDPYGWCKMADKEIHGTRSYPSGHVSRI